MRRSFGSSAAVRRRDQDHQSDRQRTVQMPLFAENSCQEVRAPNPSSRPPKSLKLVSEIPPRRETACEHPVRRPHRQTAPPPPLVNEQGE